MKKLILLTALLGGISFSSMATKMPKLHKVEPAKLQSTKSRPNDCVYSTLSCGYSGWACGPDLMAIITSLLQADAALCGD
jgi:hypothetical protein